MRTDDQSGSTTVAGGEGFPLDHSHYKKPVLAPLARGQRLPDSSRPSDCVGSDLSVEMRFCCGGGGGGGDGALSGSEPEMGREGRGYLRVGQSRGPGRQQMELTRESHQGLRTHHHCE